MRRSDRYRGPVTRQIEHSAEELEFLRTIDQYKRVNQRPFPTWKEVLAVAKALGYRKVAPPAPGALQGRLDIPGV